MARVIVLAGPSGVGKSRLAERVGLPILRLDDFYRELGDPALPAEVDWDDPGSWCREEALAAIVSLCRDGAADVPTYDISTSRRVGRRPLCLDEAPLFIAEGIFAHEIIAECRERGLLAEALCITRPPMTTALLRFTRDLREHRKPPWVLIRRGLQLMRAQSAIVRRAAGAGCRVVSPAQAFSIIQALRG